jgi:hypothetical protein
VHCAITGPWNYAGKLTRFRATYGDIVEVTLVDVRAFRHAVRLEMPIAFDLTEFAATLPGGTKERERFKAAVRACKGIHVDLIDLHSAQGMLTILADMTRTCRRQDRGFSPSEGLTARALIVSAVIHYCRATHTKSNHKPRADFETAYSPAELLAHQKVQKLRDDALAHWGPGDDGTGQLWHDNRVVFARADEREGIANPSYTTNSSAETAQCLTDLLVTAVRTAGDGLKAKRDEVYASLEALLAVDATMRERAMSYQFDPSAFYRGRSELIEAFWAAEDAAANF